MYFNFKKIFDKNVIGFPIDYIKNIHASLAEDGSMKIVRIFFSDWN